MGGSPGGWGEVGDRAAGGYEAAGGWRLGDEGIRKEAIEWRCLWMGL